MQLDSKLVAGPNDLESFCLEFFQLRDPVILIWCTEEKPDFLFESAVSTKISITEDINLFFRDDLESLFFPNGFVSSDWNLVLISIKDELCRTHTSANGIIKGWMMGTDITSQFFIGGKILVKLS